MIKLASEFLRRVPKQPFSIDTLEKGLDADTIMMWNESDYENIGRRINENVIQRN